MPAECVGVIDRAFEGTEAETPASPMSRTCPRLPLPIDRGDEPAFRLAIFDIGKRFVRFFAISTARGPCHHHDRRNSLPCIEVRLDQRRIDRMLSKRTRTCTPSAPPRAMPCR